MRNSYDHHHSSSISSCQRNILHLPLLCRFSLKDVKESNFHRVRDPSSPKVSCIGQVYRVLSPTATVGHLPQPVKHTATKPRKSLSCSFPNKTLLLQKNNKPMRTRNRAHPFRCKKKEDAGDGCCVDISNMDPPLPVSAKKKKMNAVGEVNLWKRRLSGENRHNHELEGLKIERLRLGNCTVLLNNHPPTTV